jgi:hypothetical protein
VWNLGYLNPFYLGDFNVADFTSIRISTVSNSNVQTILYDDLYRFYAAPGWYYNEPSPQNLMY